MRDLAIRNIYPQVVTINNKDDARDKDNETVILDEALISEEIIRLKELPPPKEEQLNSLIVTVNTKRFYADPDSRVDIMTTIMVAEGQGATDTAEINWKTPDGIIAVTLLELKQANEKAVQAKAGIIGVV